MSITDIDVPELAYPRRRSRRIAGNTFTLEPPTAAISKKMQRIPNEKTSIELIFENMLRNAGLLFARPDQLINPLPGRPDFVLPKWRIAIFCDGDFWHGYEPKRKTPNNNSDFWTAKIDRNIARDAEVRQGIHDAGWKVLRFWEHEIKREPEKCVATLKSLIAKQDSAYTCRFNFVDLFAGIGGFRIPLERLGGKCLGFAEIDRAAKDVYRLNFLGAADAAEVDLGSVSELCKLPFENIDLLVGGVPCQAWSVAGKMRGFDDPRGRLWFDTLRIVEENKPKSFIFENVKGLFEPRNRHNLRFLVDSFENLGYTVRFDLLNSYDFGLPQNRDRVFIVGIRNDLPNAAHYHFPVPIAEKVPLGALIDDVSTIGRPNKKFHPQTLFGDRIPMGRNRFQQVDELNDFFVFCDTRNGHTTIHSWELTRTTEREKQICMAILKNRRRKKYGPRDGNPLSFDDLAAIIPALKEKELCSLIAKGILKYVPQAGYEFVNSKNSAGINGIYRVYLPHSTTFSTLTATGTRDMVALKTISASSPSEYKDLFLSEIVRRKAYRPISAQEAGRLQAFPGWFALHEDAGAAKKQFGNAVSTEVVFHVSQNLLDIIAPYAKLENNE